MSIFNSFAALASGAGLEYETGTFTLLNSSTSIQTVSFSNTHTRQPAFACAVNTNSVSSSYTTFAMTIAYGLLLGSPRGGSASYYAQRISGRGTTTSMTVNQSITEANFPSSTVLTTTSAVFNCNSSYPFTSGTWKWIAIWAPEN